MTSPVSTAVLAVRDTFLDAVRAVDLLTPSQFARAESIIPHEVETATEAAQLLVAAGLLTKFQAERLLAGRADGFRLGPYLIQEQVGRGSMGRVYKAKHRTMNRSVAIKVLSAELTRTAAARQALQREVRAAAQLSHSNIVTAYDANELADRYYLVLEFVDGPNLETLVHERGPLPLAVACELARQAALGLAHAHSHGMVHGDITPTNLLLARSSTESGHIVKIADFGVAKLAPALATMAGKFLGNPDYVAPEGAQNPQSADHRTDLYSLGAVLYFLLVGQPPFPGGTTEEKIRRHTCEEPIWIERLRPDVHPVVANLIHQLLAKQPQFRPGSAAEVASKLEDAFGIAPLPINYDLPAPNVGPYSFVSVQLGGCHPPMPVASPWEQIAEEKIDEHSPTRKTQLRGRYRFSIWGMSGLLAAIILVFTVVAAVVMKVMAK